MHLTEMFEAMEHGDAARGLRDRREPRAVRGRPDARRCGCSTGLDHLVVQDLFLTQTAQLADVVLPAASTLGEAEGTVTSSERRVQRVRKALDPPGEARDDIEIVYELARRLGHDLGSPRAEDVWNELRSLSPDARRHELRAARGARRHPVAVPRRGRPGHAVPPRRGCGTTSSRTARRSSVVEHSPPVDLLDDDFPLRLTTGRRLESYNTGVQSGGYASPLHAAARRSCSRPRTARATASPTARASRVVSRRGSVEAPVRYDTTLRPGLAFMNLHFPDEVATNVLTIDATDPKSGTAEFKATAIRLEAV